MIPDAPWNGHAAWDDTAKQNMIRFPLPKAAYWRTGWTPSRNVSLPDELFLLNTALGRGNQMMRVAGAMPDTYLFMGAGYEPQSRRWLVVKNQYEFDMLAKS